ncbi:MAG: hypothetical protein IJY36_01825 [Coprobacter sp.]|nr:hypothetical protein [Coprobacter sp.]
MGDAVSEAVAANNQQIEDNANAELFGPKPTSGSQVVVNIDGSMQRVIVTSDTDASGNFAAVIVDENDKVIGNPVAFNWSQVVANPQEEIQEPSAQQATAGQTNTTEVNELPPLPDNMTTDGQGNTIIQEPSNPQGGVSAGQPIQQQAPQQPQAPKQTLSEDDDAEVTAGKIMAVPGVTAVSARGIAEAHIAKAKKGVAEAKRVKPTIDATEDMEGYVAEMATIADNIAMAEARVAYWEDVLAEVSNRKPTAEEQQKADNAQARREAKAEKPKSIAERVEALGEPINLTDYIIRKVLGGMKLRWGNSSDSATKGLGAHLGFSGVRGTTERNRRLWLLDNENGVYPEQAAEAIFADLQGEYPYMAQTEQDVFNELLDVLRSADTKSSLVEMAEGMRVQPTEQEVSDMEEEIARANAEARETYEPTEGEMRAIEEQRRTEEEAQDEYVRGLAENASERVEEEPNELDENGRPFVKSSDGSTVFGEITEDTGFTPAPIKLSEGYQDDDGKGYGLAHIEANHGAQIRSAGFGSVKDFVSYVAQNYDEGNIKVGNNRTSTGATTYLIQVTDKHDNTLYIELSRDGSYWNVNSGGIFRKGYSDKKETVVKTEPQQPKNANSSGSSLSVGENNGISATEPNGEPTVSTDKGNEISEESNGSGEKKRSPVSASSSDIETEPEGKRNGTATPQNEASTDKDSEKAEESKESGEKSEEYVMPEEARREFDLYALKDVNSILKGLSYRMQACELKMRDGRATEEDMAKYAKYKVWHAYLTKVKAKKEAIKKRNKWGVKSGNNAVPRDTLRKMFDAWNGDEALGELFDRVMAVFERMGVRVVFDDKLGAGTTVGYYNVGKGLIKFPMKMIYNEDVADLQKNASTILHEMIHAVTQYAIELKNMPNTRASLGIELTPEMIEAVEILEDVYRQISGDVEFRKQYGTTNVHEMVAELSNPEFRELLKRKTLWGRVVEAIKRLFGIEETDALSGVSRALERLLDDFNLGTLIAVETAARMQSKRKGVEGSLRLSDGKRSRETVRERAKRVLAEEMAERYGGITVLYSDEIGEEEKDYEAKRKSMGYVETSTGNVVIVLDNNPNVAEIAKTILHEVAAHRGVPGLLGKERANAFYAEVYAGMRESDRERIYQAYKPHIDRLKSDEARQRYIADEYIASVAEGGVNNSVLRRLVALVREVLRDLGISLTVTDSDIVDVLRRANAHEIRENSRMRAEREVFVERLDKIEERKAQLAKAEKFIEEELSKNNPIKRFEIELPLSTSRKVRAVMGRDFDSHSIEIGGVRHALKNHGVDGKKLGERSIPITAEDAKLIPYIMVAPDYVRRGSTDIRGRESVQFYKKLSNGYVVVVEKELTRSADDLETINMWAEKTLSNADLPTRGQFSTSETAGIGRSDIAKIRKDAELAIEEDEKNAEKIHYRVANAHQEIFVSNAARAVEGISQGKATPEQWLKMIENKGGLKAGEDKWIGLSDWLKGHDAKSLTKEEVLDYINSHKIVIEEVTYSLYGWGLVDDAAEKLKKEYWEIGWEAMMEKYPGIDTFFEPYNGEIFWSENKASVGEYEDFIIDSQILEIPTTDEAINETRESYTTVGLERKREIALTVPTIEPYKEYDEIHFGDAGGGRAVAWVRFGETTDNKGNTVLVIDEVQSKRHQDGRENGYRTTEQTVSQQEAEDALRIATREFNAYRDALKEKYNYDALGGSLMERTRAFMDAMTAEERERYSELNTRRADAERVLQSLREPQIGIDEIEITMRDGMKIGRYGDMEIPFEPDVSDTFILHTFREQVRQTRINDAIKRVPDAPFDKNWAELAMKRMLRYAAENGYDKVAWTTGAQQASRYGIGGVVDYITSEDYGVGDDGSITRLIELHMHGDRSNERLEVDKNGIILDGLGKGGRLSDVVGKEIADELLSGVVELSSEGLTIGGDGMRGFYDKMLPSFMNKYVKKWGSKVEDVGLPYVEEAGRVMHSVAVTDEMRDSVMEGQTMFRMATKEGDVRYRREEEANYREGEGAYSDDAVSYENDPIAKVVGRSRRTAGERKAFAERERGRMVERAKELARVMHLDNVEIRTDVEGLQGKKRKAKGWYDVETGKIVVVIPNHASARDVMATMLHEAVAHKGLRALFGENFDTFLDNVYRNADKAIRDKIADMARRNGWDFRVATEEYLAGLAERTDFENVNAGWWAKIKELFADMMRRIGMAGWNETTLTDNELRYILWRSYDNMKHPGRRTNVFDVARDVAKQAELGVGNYSARAYASVGRVAEGELNPSALPGTSPINRGGAMESTEGEFMERLTTPIYESKGTFANLSEAERWAKSYLQGASGVNRYTGERITIGRKSVSEMLNEDAVSKSGGARLHMAALRSVLDFIETGIPGEVHEDTHGRGFDVMRLYNAIRIDGKVYRVKSTVRKVQQGDNYYTYEIQKMELVEKSRSDRNREGETPRNGNNATNSITVANLLKGVKKTNSDEEILQGLETLFADRGFATGDDSRYRQWYGGNSGYVGYSKSKRAVDAEERGLRNASQMNADFAKEVNRIVEERTGEPSKITLKKIKEVLGKIKADEWHHTSKFGNKTNYYSAETVASYFAKDPEEEEYERIERERERERKKRHEEYSKAVRAKLPITQVKTKIGTFDGFVTSDGYVVDVPSDVLYHTDNRKLYAIGELEGEGYIFVDRHSEWYDNNREAFNKAVMEYVNAVEKARSEVDAENPDMRFRLRDESVEEAREQAEQDGASIANKGVLYRLDRDLTDEATRRGLRNKSGVRRLLDKMERGLYDDQAPLFELQKELQRMLGGGFKDYMRFWEHETAYRSIASRRQEEFQKVYGYPLTEALAELRRDMEANGLDADMHLKYYFYAKTLSERYAVNQREGEENPFDVNMAVLYGQVLREMNPEHSFPESFGNDVAEWGIS